MPVNNKKKKANINSNIIYILYIVTKKKTHQNMEEFMNTCLNT